MCSFEPDRGALQHRRRWCPSTARLRAPNLGFKAYAERGTMSEQHLVQRNPWWKTASHKVHDARLPFESLGMLTCFSLQHAWVTALPVHSGIP